MIGDPELDAGSLAGKPDPGAHPDQDGALIPVDFCVNVTLNRRREITAVFCGDVTAVHDAGCASSGKRRWLLVIARCRLSVTTNSGHPLGSEP